MEHEQNSDAAEHVFQIEEVSLADIGAQLIELSQRLGEAGRKIDGRYLYDESGKTAYSDENGDLDEDDIARENAITHAAFRRTLINMRQFRREYDRWERLAVEYALKQMGYTHRDAATTLGVAPSTINRWAQNPLKVEDYR